MIQNAISENTGTAAPFDYKVQLFDSSGDPFIVDVELDLERGMDAVQLSGDYNTQGVEVWPLIMEMAFAQAQGGYDQIDTGGFSDATWELLTGAEASSEDLQGVFEGNTDAEIEQMIRDALSNMNGAQGVMASTVSDPPDLVGNHAYAVLNIPERCTKIGY